MLSRSPISESDRLRRWWRQRTCRHVLYFDDCGPIYSVRPIKMTPANHQRWWAWSLGEYTCPRCGMEFMDCSLGGRPL